MKLKYNSPVILTFTILCGLVLILNYFTGGASNRLLFCTYRASLLNPFTYIRMFTHVFGHTGIEHYTSNMMFLVLLGPMLEEKYGSKKIMFVMAISAVSTAIANAVLGNNALLGASGIVFSFVMLSSMTAFNKKEIPITMLVVAALYIQKEVVTGIIANDNISQMGHVVGGITGTVCGYVIKPKIQNE